MAVTGLKNKLLLMAARTEYKENGSQGSGWYTGTCLSQDSKSLLMATLKYGVKLLLHKGFGVPFGCKVLIWQTICLQKTAKLVRKSI